MVTTKICLFASVAFMVSMCTFPNIQELKLDLPMGHGLNGKDDQAFIFHLI
jgi:hypothetical protein